MQRKKQGKAEGNLQQAVDIKEKENIKLFNHRFSQTDREVKAEKQMPVEHQIFLLNFY